MRHHIWILAILSLLIGAVALGAIPENRPSPQFTAEPTVLPTPARDDELSDSLVAYMAENYGGSEVQVPVADWYRYIAKSEVHLDMFGYYGVVTLTQKPYDSLLCRALPLLWNKEFPEPLLPTLRDVGAYYEADESEMLDIGMALHRILTSNGDLARDYSRIEEFGIPIYEADESEMLDIGMALHRILTSNGDLARDYSRIEEFGIPIVEYAANFRDTNVETVRKQLDTLGGREVVDEIIRCMERDYSGSFTGFATEDLERIATAVFGFEGEFLGSVHFIDDKGERLDVLSNPDENPNKNP